jgi:hypothetical protein
MLHEDWAQPHEAIGDNDAKSVDGGTHKAWERGDRKERHRSIRSICFLLRRLPNR